MTLRTGSQRYWERESISKNHSKKCSEIRPQTVIHRSKRERLSGEAWFINPGKIAR